MPAFNFQRQWAPAVEAGALQARGGAILAVAKRTTIRRAGRAKVGDTLYLYTGQRTAACQKLGEVLCLGVTPLQMTRDAAALRLGGRLLAGEPLERFARMDTAGLWGANDLLRFLDETYPAGQAFELYCW